MMLSLIVLDDEDDNWDSFIEFVLVKHNCVLSCILQFQKRRRTRRKNKKIIQRKFSIKFYRKQGIKFFLFLRTPKNFLRKSMFWWSIFGITLLIKEHSTESIFNLVQQNFDWIENAFFSNATPIKRMDIYIYIFIFLVKVILIKEKWLNFVIFVQFMTI